MTKSKLITSGALLLVFAAQLNAAFQVQTIMLDTANVLASGSLSGDSSESVGANLEDLEFVFDPFDTSRGTLNDVTIDLSITYSFSMTSSSLVTTASSDEFEVHAVIDYSLLYSIDGSEFYGDADANGYLSNKANEAFLVSSTPSDRRITSDFLGDWFEGSDSITFNLAYQDAFGSGFHFEADGYFTSYSVQRDAGAFVVLNYEYTPVPEPSTYAAVFAMTVFGFVCGTRRRMRAA